jgi:predicted RNase H-like HicB family nuclease
VKREYTVIFERDEAGYYVAEVPELYGCHTQAKSLDELMDRVKEAIELCREVDKEKKRPRKHLVGMQKIAV